MPLSKRVTNEEFKGREFTELTLMGFLRQAGYFLFVCKHQNQAPLVSITFPIHRFHQYATEAFTSLINQTYQNIEVMFLDNSRDGLASKFDLSDSRVQYFKLPADYGLSDTLNFALEHARGTYLARMDYDDIALPNRIEKQVAFMEKNPDIAISGTKVFVIGNSIDKNVRPGQEVGKELLHEALVRNLWSKNPFFHPTVIFRLSEIRKKNLKYRRSHDSSEDLDLWARASRVVRLANIEEPLLHYRLHPNQYSRLDGDRSSLIASRIHIKHALWLLTNRQVETWLGIKVTLKLSARIFVMLLRKRKKKFTKFT